MIDIQKLKQHLAYDPETGEFTWLIRGKSRRDQAGRIAKDSGYHLISIDYKEYRAHRLAFAIMTGKWPDDEIDHINGKRADNRWCNLREATQTQNQQNRRSATRHNKLGVQGVRQLPSGRFVGQLSNKGKALYLGSFDTIEEAHTAYVEAKRKLHEFNTL